MLRVECAKFALQSCAFSGKLDLGKFTPVKTMRKRVLKFTNLKAKRRFVAR